MVRKVDPLQLIWGGIRGMGRAPQEVAGRIRESGGVKRDREIDRDRNEDGSSRSIQLAEGGGGNPDGKSDWWRRQHDRWWS